MPRTLAQNAQYIAETIKPAIKSAIEAQGVTVPSTDSFLDYADRIAEIEGGGSGYQLKDLPTGSISTVNDAAPLPLNALKVSVEAWQEGSGDPSPSNIRPIHGWDSGEIKDVGKNLFDKNNIYSLKAYINSSGTITSNGNTRSVYVRCKANATYTVSRLAGKRFHVGYTNAIPAIEDTVTRDVADNEASSITITTDSTANYLIAYIYHSAYDTASLEDVYNSLQIEENSSATTYEPYQGKQYTQQFPSTIYGAEWDVVGGPLEEGYGFAEYDGSEAWVLHPNGVGRFYLDELPSGISSADKADAISNQATYRDAMGSYGAFFVIGGSGIYINRLSESETLQDFQTRLSNNKFTIKYPLATPTTIQLSPLSIRLLEGTNNVYADCGEVIEGEYFVDEGAIDVRKVDYQIGSSGSIKTTDGRVLSGFASMSGYHARPLDASGNWLDVDWSKDFEVCVAFKYTDSGASGITVLLGYNYNSTLNSRFQSPLIYIDKDHSRDLCLEIGSNGSSWMVDQSLSYAITLDTWYALRLKFTLSTLTLECSISTDFDTWTSLYNNTLSAAPYHSNTSMIGIGSGCQASAWASNGLLVDTFNTYIKGDGVNWGASTGAFPS